MHGIYWLKLKKRHNYYTVTDCLYERKSFIAVKLINELLEQRHLINKIFFKLKVVTGFLCLDFNHDYTQLKQMFKIKYF